MRISERAAFTPEPDLSFGNSYRSEWAVFATCRGWKARVNALSMAFGYFASLGNSYPSHGRSVLRPAMMTPRKGPYKGSSGTCLYRVSHLTYPIRHLPRLPSRGRRYNALAFALSSALNCESKCEGTALRAPTRPRNSMWKTKGYCILGMARSAAMRKG